MDMAIKILAVIWLTLGIVIMSAMLAVGILVGHGLNDWQHGDNPAPIYETPMPDYSPY